MSANPLARFLGVVGESRDLALGVLIIMTIALMVLPMPSWLVDGLIGVNFCIAVMLLMTAIYLASPVELSSLPGIILISTIFRLALSVTTTRLILSEGSAGAIIETFGSFVIGGNLVVGLVVFFIVTVVQFIVIAKGSERIAEVGARFTLDALPGKQMSIDGELRNGDIDHQEAGRRRKLLERESQFYGAMDGTMKFVKGDAIAGLVIIAVNLVGGIVIGAAQMGLSFAEAGRLFALLTIGDALVSQIPALLVSTTAAIVVTRVQGERKRNLGGDIFGQLLSEKRALAMTAVTLGGMALIPGFPTGTLLALAAAIGGAALLAGRRERERAVRETEAPPAEAPAPALPGKAPVVLVISADLDGAGFRERVVGPVLALRARLEAEIGMPCPEIGLRADETRGELVEIEINEVPVATETVAPGTLALTEGTDFAAVLELPRRPAPAFLGETALLVGEEHRAALEGAGLEALGTDGMALLLLERTLRRHYASFIGVQETQAALAACEKEQGALLAEVLRSASVQKIAEVVRRLVQEDVPVGNRRLLLEALAEWDAPDHAAVTLTEYVRVSFGRHICHRVADPSRVISAVLIERGTEEFLRERVRETTVGTYLVLEDTQSRLLLNELRAVAARMRTPAARTGPKPVLLTAMNVRRHLRTFLERNGVEFRVMSFQEVAPGYTVVPVSTLSLALPEALTVVRTDAQEEAA